MKHLKFLVLAVLSQAVCVSLGFAGELILDQAVLEKVSKQARENPYRLKLIIGSKEIFNFEIGRSVTPFFTDTNNGILKRRYQGEKNCFEVSFFEKVNMARKIGCYQLMDDLVIPGFPTFFAVKVSDLFKGSLNSFDFWNSSSTYQLTGFVHTRDTIRMDQLVLNLKDLRSFPTQNFKVMTQASGKVSLDPKSGLLISQNHTLLIGKIGIQDERTLKTTSSIKRSLDQWVYTDGKGKVILLNDWLIPMAFQNFLLAIQPKFHHFVKDLESRSTQGAVCYRDSWIGPLDQDCYHLLTRSFSPVEYTPFRLLMVDFPAGIVERVSLP